MFWAKTRMGWKETNVQEHTDRAALHIPAPVFNFNPIKPKMINFEYPAKLHESFVNPKTIMTLLWEGGTRSGAKSQTLACIGVAESFIDDGVILCCREIQKSIVDSLYATIVSCIYKYKLESYFKILQTEITNLVNRCAFYLCRVKTNITSIKSIDKLRVVLTDEAENISQTSWDYLGRHHAMVK